MLIVNLEDARPGMRLAAPVAHPENPQQDLLKQGYCLEASTIPRLREFGIPALYVDYPGLDDLDRHLASQLSPARQTMYRQVRDTMLRVQGRTAPAVSFTDYYAVTREMVTTVLSQGAHPIYMERMSAINADAVAHATTVAHLSMVLGLRLETYLIRERSRLAPQHAKEVVNLGVAGMLHDIGKLRLPESLHTRCELDGPKPDDSDDVAAREEWAKHPRIGYEMLRGGIESSAAVAVLHHHQHFERTSPEPVGDQPVVANGINTAPAPAGEAQNPPADSRRQHVFARILYVADLYANLARPPAGNMQRCNLEVLHAMRRDYGLMMDPVVFRALECVAPPFPPGCQVVLGDNTTAVVVAVRATNPYEPIVRRFKPGSEELDGIDVNLAEHGAPALVSIVGGPAVASYIPDPRSVTQELAIAQAA